MSDYMNKEQRAYAQAVARRGAVEEAIKEAEAEYLERKNVIDPETGKLVHRIFEIIWDEELFDQINNSFAREHKALCDEYSEAHKAEKAAEEALIEFGISIAPVEHRQTLIYGVKRIYKIRKQFIDGVFRLDTRTLPKEAKA